MASQKKLTAVFGALFATALLFFIGIFIFASLYGEDVTTVQEIDTAFTIYEMRVDIDWNNDRSCKIKQELDVVFDASRHGIYVDIPVNSGERIRNLNVKATDKFGSVRYEISHEAGNRIVRVKVGDANKYIYKGEHLECIVEYDYLTPEHPEDKNALDINAIGTGWTCYIDNAIVTVNFPTAVQDSAVSVWVSGNERKVPLINDGKTITLETGTLRPFHGVRVKATMLSGVLKGSGFEGIVTVVVGVVLVIAVILLMVFVG
ncbi:MAG: DUF2207 domain-containing protein, partial [Clostridiales bacterium]|nr:DUF2207 domain-containing protein [Clostridiales bacterium]